MNTRNRPMLVMGTIIVGLLVIIAVLGTLLLMGNHRQPNTTSAVQHAQATLTAMPTATPRPFTIIGTFQGVEGGQTSIFFTSTNWVLAWSCNPIINGVSGTYPLSIADEASPTSPMQPPPSWCRRRANRGTQTAWWEYSSQVSKKCSSELRTPMRQGTQVCLMLPGKSSSKSRVDHNDRDAVR